jgi:hypothetical protein
MRDFLLPSSFSDNVEIMWTEIIPRRKQLTISRNRDLNPNKDLESLTTKTWQPYINLLNQLKTGKKLSELIGSS